MCVGWPGRGVCLAEDMCGRGCVCGRRVWQDRWPLQRTVRVLLECILVKINTIKVLTYQYPPD